MNQSLILAISSSYWLAHNFLPSPIDLWIKAYRGRWCQQGQVVSEMAEIWSVNGQLYFEGCVCGGGGGNLRDKFTKSLSTTVLYCINAGDCYEYKIGWGLQYRAIQATEKCTLARIQLQCVLKVKSAALNPWRQIFSFAMASPSNPCIHTIGIPHNTFCALHR